MYEFSNFSRFSSRLCRYRGLSDIDSNFVRGHLVKFGMLRFFFAITVEIVGSVVGTANFTSNIVYRVFRDLFVDFGRLQVFCEPGSLYRVFRDLGNNLALVLV